MEENNLTKESVELELTSALKIIVFALRDIGFGDSHILGKVNLCLQGFIKDDGDFTDEYKELALEALKLRQRADQGTPSIIVDGI